MQVYGTQLEEVEAGYLALLQQNMNDALQAVQDYWEERGDPLYLPQIPPDEWHRGGMPDGEEILTIINLFPAVTVEAVSLNKVSETIGESQIIVTAYTLSQESPDHASKLAHRYATAVCTILWDKKPKGVLNTAALSIDLSQTASVPDKYQSYLKGARVGQTVYVSAML